jgi:hypothetical protein
MQTTLGGARCRRSLLGSRWRGSAGTCPRFLQRYDVALLCQALPNAAIGQSQIWKPRRIRLRFVTRKPLMIFTRGQAPRTFCILQGQIMKSLCSSTHFARMPRDISLATRGKRETAAPLVFFGERFIIICGRTKVFVSESRPLVVHWHQPSLFIARFYLVQGSQCEKDFIS